MIVDFRKCENPLATFCIGGAAVKTLPSSKYLGRHINNDPTMQNNSVSLIKISCISRAGTAAPTLFYRLMVENILHHMLLCRIETSQLQQVVKSTQRLTSSRFPTIKDIYRADAGKLLPASWKTLPTPLTDCLPLSPQVERCTASGPAQPDYFPEAVRLTNCAIH